MGRAAKHSVTDALLSPFRRQTTEQQNHLSAGHSTGDTDLILQHCSYGCRTLRGALRRKAPPLLGRAATTQRSRCAVVGPQRAAAQQPRAEAGLPRPQLNDDVHVDQLHSKSQDRLNGVAGTTGRWRVAYKARLTPRAVLHIRREGRSVVPDTSFNHLAAPGLSSPTASFADTSMVTGNGASALLRGGSSVRALAVSRGKQTVSKGNQLGRAFLRKIINLPETQAAPACLAQGVDRAGPARKRPAREHDFRGRDAVGSSHLSCALFIFTLSTALPTTSCQLTITAPH